MRDAKNNQHLQLSTNEQSLLYVFQLILLLSDATTGVRADDAAPQRAYVEGVVEQ